MKKVHEALSQLKGELKLLKVQFSWDRLKKGATDWVDRIKIFIFCFESVTLIRFDEQFGSVSASGDRRSGTRRRRVKEDIGFCQGFMVRRYSVAGWQLRFQLEGHVPAGYPVENSVWEKSTKFRVQFRIGKSRNVRNPISIQPSNFRSANQWCRICWIPQRWVSHISLFYYIFPFLLTK